VNFIEDNLIAEGKALPMIIAMPNNQVVHRMDPDHTPRSFQLLEEEMLKVVIPLVDNNYSTVTNKHGRAIAGLSMGGRHAQIIGLNNLDLFGSIGILSAGESFDLNPGVFEDPDLNDKIDYLFVGAGTHETTPGSRQAVLHKELEDRHVKHVYYIGSDGAHDFVTWRHLIYYQFLPNLWRTD
jgi:enterochelin esterase family protein